MKKNIVQELESAGTRDVIESSHQQPERTSAETVSVAPVKICSITASPEMRQLIGLPIFIICLMLTICAVGQWLMKKLNKWLKDKKKGSTSKNTKEDS